MFFLRNKKGNVAGDNLIWWILVALLLLFGGIAVVRILG